MATNRAPRASIIIPTFNAARLIRESVESALAQTESNIEVICIDDGSSDNTPAILNAMAATDDRMRVLTQENSGGGRARNSALDIARGDYLFFLDADDRFDKSMVEHMIAALDEQNADIATCQARTLNDATGLVEPASWVFREAFVPDQQPFSWRDMPNRIFNTFANVPWNKAFRRSFIEQHGLRFQEVRRTNDCLFVCSALVCAERLTTVDETLVTYRVGGVANCQATNDDSCLDFFTAFKALKHALELRGLFADVERSFTNHALDAVMYNLHSLKSYASFDEVYRALPTMEDEFHFLAHEDEFYYDQEQWLDYKALRSMSQAQWLFQLGRHRHNDIMGMKNEMALLRRSHDALWSQCKWLPHQLARRCVRKVRTVRKG